VLLGALTGAWLAQKERVLGDRLAGMFAVGAIAMVIGACWGWVFPINKGLWTSSYVIFTGGMAAVSLATCLWLIDGLGVKGWTRFFVVYGINPLVAFLGSGLMARLIGGMIVWQTDTGRTSLQQFVYREGFASWLAPKNASFLFAISFVMLWYLILSMLHRRGVIVKL